jgi:protein-S-isoprenylcysteine O-methyltransferase Ste14
MIKAASIIGYGVMLAGVLGLVFTKRFFSPSPFVLVPQACAVVLMIWARITFGRRSFHLAANPTAGGLVTTGPYRFIRHPIYTAVCLFCLPAVVAFWSSQAALFGSLIVAGTLTRIFSEEALLRKQEPEYAKYALRTWRMLPPLF